MTPPPPPATTTLLDQVWLEECRRAFAGLTIEKQKVRGARLGARLLVGFLFLFFGGGGGGGAALPNLLKGESITRVAVLREG